MTTSLHERVPEWTRGDRLRKARSVTGLTVREFADEIGISPKSVNNYEGDHVEPRKVVMNAWALRTGVPVQWLETGTAPVDGPGPDGEYTPRDSNPEPAD
ncbi:helix-turn-helix transcriptional regulator [Aeromicrobium sp. YIM 150415]|uniref:helix-turn-helix domain-containing protein n=1 Tax=Aeromicrobium sp. YIM 150415 TaxID=2803912 RepID=UPI001963E04C|nr:helix-turn-helix transcriptional regulator [Aeromicrobium sp. YIM 150415]